MQAAPSSNLIGPVADARSEFTGEVEEPRSTLETAEALARELPAFLGREGERRYFFRASNPAELCGTGGFIGANAILTVRDGALEFGEFAPIQDLPNAPRGTVEPPNEDYERLYGRYGGADFWLNITQVQRTLNLMTTLQGLILFNVGYYVPFGVFVFSGFMRQIPVELEEAAAIDGATRLQAF